MPANRFRDYFNDEAAAAQLRGDVIPEPLAADLLASLESGYDAFWSVIGATMRAHGVSGDDLGWDDSEARGALARAVVSLVAPNVLAPAEPYECTVIIRMPADDGQAQRPEDVTEVLDNLPGVSVVEWHDERLIGEES
jgi:hypothetical protein